MSYNEAFGLSLYEAMSRGRVCIAANNSAQLDAITDGKNGYLIEAEDAQALAEKLTFYFRIKVKN